LRTEAAQHYIPAVSMALVTDALGRNDEAISYLNKGCDDHDVWVTLLKVDPRWDSLRSDPRFSAILKRIGLE
jgi:hypothetical protein